MAPIRHISRALIVAGALSLPTLASADQAPSELCEGDKMEEKEPTAEKGDVKRKAEKSQKKADDKEQESDKKESDKS